MSGYDSAFLIGAEVKEGNPQPHSDLGLQTKTINEREYNRYSKEKVDFQSKMGNNKKNDTFLW